MVPVTLLPLMAVDLQQLCKDKVFCRSFCMVITISYTCGNPLCLPS
jgi:hypothetical protein